MTGGEGRNDGPGTQARKLTVGAAGSSSVFPSGVETARCDVLWQGNGLAPMTRR